MTQGDVLSIGRIDYYISPTAKGKPRIRNVRGSRLLQRFAVTQHAETNIGGPLRYAPKRLPSSAHSWFALSAFIRIHLRF